MYLVKDLIMLIINIFYLEKKMIYYNMPTQFLIGQKCQMEIVYLLEIIFLHMVHLFSTKIKKNILHYHIVFTDSILDISSYVPGMNYFIMQTVRIT